jgi:predicted MFS family arabinose efflux permease
VIRTSPRPIRDRRRLILVSQALMLLAAVALAVLDATGALTPATLLGLLFVIGVGGAASASTWQTLQPELVPLADRPQAIALGSVNQNLARAVGPAIGGVLLAATSAAAVFLANAVSFLAVLGAAAVTAIPARAQSLPREHVAAAVRSGRRFVVNSPTLLALIVRASAFIFPAGAIWALLPLVANHRLGLGSGGYGLLLGCVGLGALAAASFGPTVRRHIAPRAIYALACLALAAAALLLAVSRSIELAVVALIVAGGAWITALGELPRWVKSRGVSYYLVAFQGANAVGALVLGGIAEANSVSVALGVVAASLTVVAAATSRLALPTSAAGTPMSEVPLPMPDLNPPVEDGPVVITVRYHVRPEAVAAFLKAARELRRTRRRTGATHWHLHRDLADTNLFEEMFVVGSWQEHERQHERLQGRERDVLDGIDHLLQPGEPRVASHAIAIRPTRSKSRWFSF